MIIGVIDALKLQIFNRFLTTILHHCTKRISIEQVINVPNVICTYYHHEQLYNTSFTTLLKTKYLNVYELQD